MAHLRWLAAVAVTTLTAVGLAAVAWGLGHGGALAPRRTSLPGGGLRGRRGTPARRHVRARGGCPGQSPYHRGRTHLAPAHGGRHGRLECRPTRLVVLPGLHGHAVAQSVAGRRRLPHVAGVRVL